MPTVVGVIPVTVKKSAQNVLAQGLPDNHFFLLFIHFSL